MTARALSYAVITPARNEAENLPRLAAALAAQTVPPKTWAIVDNGSDDGTSAVAEEIARDLPWVVVRSFEPSEGGTRATPIVRAFTGALDAIDPGADVVVKLDADVTFDPDHFQLLLAEFAADYRLGITSGSCFEREDGEWKQRHVTGDHVWGAVRAYRRECLLDVLPLEERLGWDGIDELKAALAGWRTRTVLSVPFYHHRREGAREGGRWATWAKNGRACHYLDYRVGYLVARTLHRMTQDAAALGMLWGYVRAALRREARCEDAAVRAYVRKQQTLRQLPLRVREAYGRRAA